MTPTAVGVTHVRLMSRGYTQIHQVKKIPGTPSLQTLDQDVNTRDPFLGYSTENDGTLGNLCKKEEFGYQKALKYMGEPKMH